MVWYNWLIALVVVILTPLSLFVAYFIAKGCHNMFAMQAKKRGELSGLVTEMLSSQRVVKLFGYEKRAEDRFAVINQDLKKWGQNAAFFSAMTNPCTRFVNNVVYVVVCVLGAFLVIKGNAVAGLGTLTVGALSCVLSYATQYTKPFNEITGVVTELQTATAAATRVFDLLESPDQSSDEGFEDLTDVDGNISIDDVYFSYVKTNPLIQGFSLKVKSGQRIAIVGPTGCGKTTLINLLMRFYDADSGKIEVEGKDITKVTRKSLRASYGMVLQDTWLKKARCARISPTASPMLPMKKSSKPQKPRIFTPSSPALKTAMTPCSAMTAAIYPKVKNNCCASRALCSRIRPCSFWTRQRLRSTLARS